MENYLKQQKPNAEDADEDRNLDSLARVAPNALRAFSSHGKDRPSSSQAWLNLAIQYLQGAKLPDSKHQSMHAVETLANYLAMDYSDLCRREGNPLRANQRLESALRRAGFTLPTLVFIKALGRR